MKKILVGWDNALQGESYTKAHQCYQAAFKSIGSNLLDSWTIENTKSLQGISPNIIWADENLWGIKCVEAKEAFYRAYEQLPPVALREGAKEFLQVAYQKGYEVVIVTQKTQEILDKEVSYLGVSEFCSLSIGSGIYKCTRADMLQRALGSECLKDILVVASEGYRVAAMEMGLNFKPASTETFYQLTKEG